MTRTLIGTLLCLLCSCLQGQEEIREITSEFIATIDGREVRLPSGSEKIVEINGKRVSMVVRESPTKKFDNGEISFQFPSGHATAKGGVAPVTRWSFRKGISVLLVARLPSGEAQSLEEEMIARLYEQFGKEKCKAEKLTTSLGKEKLEGTRLVVPVLRKELIQETLRFSTSDADYLVVIQSIPSQMQSDQTDFLAIKELLKATFAVTRK